jgi:hypothetical protein
MGRTGVRYAEAGRRLDDANGDLRAALEGSGRR